MKAIGTVNESLCLYGRLRKKNKAKKSPAARLISTIKKTLPTSTFSQNLFQFCPNCDMSIRKADAKNKVAVTVSMIWKRFVILNLPLLATDRALCSSGRLCYVSPEPQPKNDLRLKIYSFAQQRSVTLELLHNSQQKADGLFVAPLLHKTPCWQKCYLYVSICVRIWVVLSTSKNSSELM